MKYLRDKNIGCTSTVKGNMLGDYQVGSYQGFSGGKHWCRDCDVEW